MAAVVVEKIFNAAGCTHVVKISLYVILDFIPKTTEESQLRQQQKTYSLSLVVVFYSGKKKFSYVLYFCFLQSRGANIFEYICSILMGIQFYIPQ